MTEMPLLELAVRSLGVTAPRSDLWLGDVGEAVGREQAWVSG